MKEDVFIPDHSEPPVFAPESANREARIELACEVMHDAYELAAVSAGWETQAQSRKPWADVPEANKVTMRAAVSALLNHLSAGRSGYAIGEALGLFPSVIRSGEHWSGTCQVVLDKARAELALLTLQTAPKASDGDGTSSAKVGSGMTPENEASQ